MPAILGDLAAYTGASWAAWPAASTGVKAVEHHSAFAKVERAKPAGQVAHVASIHYYKDTTERLELLRSETHTVLIEDKPFASGGVCEAFHIWILGNDNERGPMQVAKRYIFKEGTKGFREDHVNWYMASRLVDPFNEQLAACLPNCPKVRLIQSVRLMELRGEWYSVEDYIEGKFRKFNNIFGDVERPPLPGEDTTYFDLAAAFSHFSFCHSGNDYIVLDIQGVNNTYTDVAVVSRQTSKFGYTDTGLPGLQGFFKKHVCNGICAKMGLPPVNGRSLPVQSARYELKPRRSRATQPLTAVVKQPPITEVLQVPQVHGMSRYTKTSPAASPVPWETTPSIWSPAVTTPYYSMA